MKTDATILLGEPVPNPDGDPAILRACYPDDQIAMVRNFFGETGIAQEARVDVHALLFVTCAKGITLNSVLKAFRKHGTEEWKKQPEHYRGNPFGCPKATSIINCQIFYLVYFELGLLIPAEFALGRRQS